MKGGTGPGEITEALARLRKGDSSAQSRLAPLVYAELRRIAGPRDRTTPPPRLECQDRA